MDAIVAPIVAAVVTGGATLSASWVAFRGKKGEVSQSERAEILDNYHRLVVDLQAEVRRLNGDVSELRAQCEHQEQEITNMRMEMVKLTAANIELQSRLDGRSCEAG